MSRTLGEKQEAFSRCISKLLDWLHSNGYEVRFGEFSRSNEQAIINSLGPSGRARLMQMLSSTGQFHELVNALRDNAGSGIKNSLHEHRLAADLLLFKDGQYLNKSEQYKEAGEFWETLDDEAAWGGRFGDGNHFSLAHQGRK